MCGGCPRPPTFAKLQAASAAELQAVCGPVCTFAGCLWRWRSRAWCSTARTRCRSASSCCRPPGSLHGGCLPLWAAWFADTVGWQLGLELVAPVLLSSSCTCEPLVQCNAAVQTEARLLSSRAGFPAGGAKLLASCVPMLRRYPRLGRSLFLQHVLNCRRLTSSCASLVLYLCLLQAPSLQPHPFTAHAESMVLGLVLYLCLLQVPPLRQRFPGTGPARIAGTARAGLCACG